MISKNRFPSPALPVALLMFLLTGCGGSHKNTKEMKSDIRTGSYGYDKEFLVKSGIEFTELKVPGSGAAILVVPGWQGRVMTSTASGDTGRSFGWINHRFISSGKVSTQFNPFGGEERFWLGPEGGPFSLYFPEGSEQVFANWKVPAEIDTLPFAVKESGPQSMALASEFQLKNFKGSLLSLKIERKIRLLDNNETSELLKVNLAEGIEFVGYESENSLVNAGTNDWSTETGFLSIWMLSMFNPSENGVVFIPFRPGDEKIMGPKVNDNYFGKVPPDRLIVRNSILFFRVDGKQRGKIGITPARAKPFCGSYDPDGKVLTVLWYSAPVHPMKYVNSKWGKQADPLEGDVVNSYNDGPVEDGSVMGPFYELESSSPAAILRSGSQITHTQRIFHFTGPEEKLSAIAEKLFGITLEEVKSVFGK